MNPVNGYNVRRAGRVLRSIGKALEAVGIAFQDKQAYVEKLVPSTRVVPIKGKQAEYGRQHFVASTASLVGQVKLAELSSTWYGATIKGRNTAILDNAVIASTKSAPTKIGNDVTISPGAVVSSAEIGDGAMIGMGAIIQPGAKVGSDSFVDAGAVVASGTVVPAGSLWTGAPARQLRMLTPDEMSYLRSTAGVYGALSERHNDQWNKSPQDLEAEAEELLLKRERGLKPSDELPHPTADVVEYYKLTQTWENSGLFRKNEYNLAAEDALKEADEVAADKAENEYYEQQARLRRVGASLKALGTIKPTSLISKDHIVAELASMDPAGASMLKALVGQIADVAASGNAADKSSLVSQIARIDPSIRYYEDEKEATEAASALFDAVASVSQVAAPSAKLQ